MQATATNLSEVNTTRNGTDVRDKNMTLGLVAAGDEMFWTVSYAVVHKRNTGGDGGGHPGE
jgi:hypothetical protein